MKGLDVENNLSSEEDTVEEDSVEEVDRIEKEDNDEEDNDEEEDSIEDKIEEDDIEEVKVQIIVKNKNIKTPTAKFLTIQPVTYRNFVEKIDLVVQKTLEKKIASKDYVISYKVMNSRGPLNELEDELDFQEFINEYKKVILADKKMLVMVIVKDNLTKKKNSINKHRKVNYFFIYIICYKI